MSTKKILLISHNILGFRALKKMVENRFNVIGVIARKEAKPGKIISDYCDEFEAFCAKNNIAHHEAENINNSETLEFARSLNPDVVLVMGWSQIIKDEFFKIPKIGVFGTHPSLLPKNRGSAAIPWQIINNEKESALTMFKIEPGDHPVDSGDIYAQERFPIEADESACSFYEKAVQAAEKIVETKLADVLSGKIKGKKQDESTATYLTRRRPEDGLIDWTKDREYVERFIRAVGSPYPGAFTFYKEKKIMVWKARMVSSKDNSDTLIPGTITTRVNSIIVKCGTGAIELLKITDKDGNTLNLNILKTGERFTTKEELL